MARTPTDELKYYSRDVRQQENEQYIEAVHGITGFYVLEKLRMHIYGAAGGYYCLFNKLHKHLFCKNNGNIPIETLEAILQDCFLPDVELFDLCLYEKYNILTSAGIQKRWKKVVQDAGRTNTTIKPDYCLIKQELPSGNNEDTNLFTGSLSPVNSNKEELIGDKLGSNGVVIGDIPGINYPESTQIKENNIILDNNKLELSREGELSATPSVPPAPSPPENKGKEVGNEPKKSTAAQRRRSFVPPNSEECTAYFLAATAGVWHQALAKTQGGQFFAWYSANGWVQGKSLQPIVDWKQAANGWMLREVGDEYKIEKGLMQKKIAAGINPQDSSPEKKLEFLYQKYIEGQLQSKNVDPNLYDYLKQKGMLSFPAGKNAEIRQQARKVRVSQLEGSNEASVIRLLVAYGAGAMETEEPIKSDIDSLHREARRLSIIYFFSISKDAGKDKLW